MFFVVIAILCAFVNTKSLTTDIEKIREVKLAVVEEDCQTIPFQMHVNKKNCIPTTVENNLCLGKCRSTVYMRESDFKLVSECYACAPLTYKNVTVDIECTRGRKKRTKTFRVIAECGCKKVSCKSIWNMENRQWHVTLLARGLSNPSPKIEREC